MDNVWVYYKSSVLLLDKVMDINQQTNSKMCKIIFIFNVINIYRINMYKRLWINVWKADVMHI